ncbi:MAG: right-handed parallel beta-helix repeat-containing protein, partial [Thermoplasmata archaeon]|nr:right-handed parallel beta-helix repeat-containing protein [Thermoplasmata archaeon]
MRILMGKRITYGIILMLITAIFIGLPMNTIAEETGNLIYVDDDNTSGTEDGTETYPYNTIQEGVVAANEGDTVMVASGIYDGQVHIHNPLTLIGEDEETTIIIGDGSFIGNGINIHGNWVNISGFTISTWHTGIWVHNGCTNSSIINNSLISNRHGIQIRPGADHTIRNNTFKFNTNVGLTAYLAPDLNIVNNSFYSNKKGINLGVCAGSLVYHNNFFKNEISVFDSTPWDTNWYHPGLLEGNYWSDYFGVDDGSGFKHHTIAGDDIGDTLVPHLGPDYDDCPLVWPTVGHAVHNIDKNIWYDNIEQSIVEADPGNSIDVMVSKYNERLTINKPLTLKGWIKERTIINGEGIGDVIWIRADGVEISNFTVTGSGTSFGDCALEVDGSDHCIITNNIMLDNFYGIRLFDFSKYNKVENNYCKNNHFGISVDGLSHDNIISNNDALQSTSTGISVSSDSDRNIIINNTCKFNDGQGLIIGYQCNNTTIERNICLSNGWNGIYLSDNTFNNSIKLNTCTLNQRYGLQLWESSTDNVIIKNILKSNNLGGIHLNTANDNIILNNSILSNSGTGIKLNLCNNNIIYHNNIIDNTNQAFDNGINQWYSSTSGGNFWSDWSTPDTNYDGYVDTANEIPGGTNQDNLPFSNEFGWILAGNWHFDEGAGQIVYDESKNENDGYLGGSVNPASDDPAIVEGISGYGLSFDGDNDWVTIPDDSSLDITDGLTIEAWIKPLETFGTYIVAKEQLPNYPQMGSVYTLDIYPGTVRSVFWEAGSVPPVKPAIVGETKILAGVWQHIAVTWDGEIVKVFYNGKVDGAAEFTGNLKTSTANVAFGRYGNVFFNGVIDEVRILNRALTEIEISEHYMRYPPYLIDPLIVKT